MDFFFKERGGGGDGTNFFFSGIVLDLVKDIRM